MIVIKQRIQDQTGTAQQDEFDGNTTRGQSSFQMLNFKLLYHSFFITRPFLDYKVASICFI